MQSEIQSEACSYTFGCAATRMQPEGLGSMIDPGCVLFVLGGGGVASPGAFMAHLVLASWIISPRK